MNQSPESYPTAAFDYELPRELVARYPHEARDQSRLLLLDRKTGQTQHRTFRDLVEIVRPGDALVLNETRVFPARLVGRRASGAEAEVLLLEPVEIDRDGRVLPRIDGVDPGTGTLEAPTAARTYAAAADGAGPDGARDHEARGPTLWRALVRPGSKLRAGRTVTIAPDLHVEIVDVEADGTRIVRLMTPLAVEDALERHGSLPLPPYMRRQAEAADRERYQTVYARATGSVAAPTAGLHFTRSMLDSLEGRGVRMVRLVLHVGIGTFRPVEEEDPARHRMHAERYAVSAEAAATLNAVRASGGAVWGVGTTVARTLETVADEAGIVHAGSGETRLFIRPPYRFKVLDRLITNFHLPRSTLLMLVAAFGGYEPVMRAYREAVAEGYRFYSYGDAMTIV